MACGKQVQFQSYVTSALDTAWSASRLDHFTPGKKSPWAPNKGRVGPGLTWTLWRKYLTSSRESKDEINKIRARQPDEYERLREAPTSQTGHNDHHGNVVLCPTNGPKNCYFTYRSADAKLFSSVTVSYCLLHAWNHKRDSR